MIVIRYLYHVLLGKSEYVTPRVDCCVVHLQNIPWLKETMLNSNFDRIITRNTVDNFVVNRTKNWPTPSIDPAKPDNRIRVSKITWSFHFRDFTSPRIAMGLLAVDFRPF